MTLTESFWAEVSSWFERLADLTIEERNERLSGEALNPDVRRYLDQLLSAHDTPEPLVVDRTVEGLVGALLLSPDTPPVPDQWIGLRLGAWRVLKEIRRGGMATVVLAERADGQYERQVALKVLHARRSNPGNRRSLERELQLLAGLSHPGIVHLLDGGISDEGWPYLVMELVDGEPLDRWCEHHRASLAQRVELWRQIARAVSHAHGRLIVHADLKPANVLVDREGRARLVDFGIGRLLAEPSDSTLAIGLRCSPAWAAPEQLAGEPATVASDVHGLGMLGYALLSGQPPRPASSVTRALAGLAVAATPGRPSATDNPPVASRRLQGDLDAICLRATAAAPADRYPSVEALERDLAAWAEGRPVQAHPGGRRYRLGKWLSRHKLGVASTTMALLALLLGSGLALWQARVAQDQAEQADLQAQRAETIKDFLLDMFTAADPWLAGSAELDIRDILAQGRRQAEADQSLDPETRVELLLTLGDVQVALGAYDDATSLFDTAEQLLEADSDLDTQWRVRLWLERASLHSARRDSDQVEQALSFADALLPSADTPTGRLLHARVAHGFARLYARDNRSAEAELAFERLETLLDSPGEPLLEYELLLLGNRTVLAYNRGDVQAAFDHAQAELDLLEQTGQQGSAKGVSTLSNLAATAAQLGRLDLALDYDRRGVALARTVYPADHPGIATALYAYGDTLRQHGRYDAALEVLDEARALRERRELRIEVALVDVIRVRTLLALGRGSEAVPLARATREILEEAWGSGSRTVLQLLEFELQGHAMTADRAAIAALALTATARLDQLEPENRWQPLAQMLRWRLARSHFDLGERDAAQAWLDEAGEAPDSATRHPSVELRLLGMQLLLGVDNPLAHDRTIESIQRYADVPSANSDSKAFAWCTVARDQRRREADPELANEINQRLTVLGESPTLSQEGRQDAACRVD